MVLRAAVSIKADATYVVPVAAVAYIDLVVAAELDTSGRYRIIQEIAAVVDGVAFVLSRPRADVATVADATFVSALKVLADGFAMNDGSEAVDGSVYSFSKGISNVAFTEDAVASSLAKLTQDQFALIDNAAKVLSRPLTDSAGATDDETVSALKGLADTAGMSDAVTTLLLYIRNFNDTVGVTDVQTAEFSLPKAEQVTVADVDTRDVSKPFSEDLAASDASAYVFSTAFSESSTASDSDSLIFTTSRVESVAAADVGIVSVQDYCALDYFVEDYVGISQAF
jgi:hypothetical protein